MDDELCVCGHTKWYHRGVLTDASISHCRWTQMEIPAGTTISCACAQWQSAHVVR